MIDLVLNIQPPIQYFNMLRRKSISLFLLLFVALVSVMESTAQTKKVTIQGRNRYFKTEATVLESNPAIKHGPSKTIINGVVAEAGDYDNNKKQGVWIYTSANSNERLEFDHTSNKILFDNRKSYGNVDSVFARVKQNPAAETMPVLLGSLDLLYMQIVKEFRMPSSALRVGVKGESLASIMVDENGVTTGYRIIKGIGSGVEQELLRILPIVAKNMEWLPSKTKDGTNTSGEFIITQRIETRATIR